MRGRANVRLNDLYGALGREGERQEPIGLQWRRILKRESKSDALRHDGAPRVLIAAGYGLSETKLAFETILAMALRLRGAAPSVMLIDAALTACEFNPEGGWDPEAPVPGAPARGPLARRSFCDYCRTGIRSAFAPLNVPELSLRAYLRNGDFERLTALLADVPYDAYRTFT